MTIRLCWTAAGFALSLALATLSHAASVDRWPSTPEGAVVREYVEAFAAGDSAMRVVWLRRVPPAALKEKPIESRFARYHELRDELGTLQLAGVEHEERGVLRVTLLDAHAKEQVFEFAVDPGPPARLTGIKRYLTRGHSFLGGFHH